MNKRLGHRLTLVAVAHGGTPGQLHRRSRGFWYARLRRSALSTTALRQGGNTHSGRHHTDQQ
ncbi:hypothetical protein KCP70_12070 [Salmonella enterica subsp. enterica]|nr:hypothetical protein KCP70_12070 [Salmonella enterica subsp. enterica]